ncbi:MAG: hypothetical protein H0V61_00120 [Chitinophagales bacterium]|nr:hypothetical protein [Chitinophagales bacterium]
MKSKIVMLTLMLATSVSFFTRLNAQSTTDMGGKHDMMMPDMKSWPEASQMAAREMMEKYGKPDASGQEVLGWMNKGDWKMIHVNKAETKHSFPIEHTDMLEQCISYKVPANKMSDLGRFDGSLTFDRTQGLMCARCDKEGNNLLALNLANDIVTGKKTVEEARKAYGEIVKEKMNGGNPEYMQKLTFAAQGNAADPDTNTTGLTKEDVMKGMQKPKGEK